jgi:hypothetical protein
MSKKSKKKSTAPSVPPSPPVSEPSPAPADPAQPPPPRSSTPIIEVHVTMDEIQACKDTLGSSFKHFQDAVALELPERSTDITVVHLAHFFRCAYLLGQMNWVMEEEHETVVREREEARAKGILEGKEIERAKWIGDGHVAGKECKANRNERTSIAVETDPVPSSPSITYPATTTAAVQTLDAVDEPVSLNWAEEMADIPIHSIVTAPRPVSPSRDLSVLRSSESVKPFASLQRRRSVITRSQSRVFKYPHSKLPSRSFQSVPMSLPHQQEFSSRSHSRYNWASNLFVLSDLAKVLEDIGWWPPGFLRSRV